MICERQPGISAHVDWSNVRAFARKWAGNLPASQFEVVPLHGGLESCGVYKVRYGQIFVLKQLTGGPTRELKIYEALANTPAASGMPRLLGSEWIGPDVAQMYIEYVPRGDNWPWSSLGANVAVLEQLSRVHGIAVAGMHSVAAWNYDLELEQSAADTLTLFAGALRNGVRVGDRPMLRALERTAGGLRAIRTALGAWHEGCLLHGDMHTGNVHLHKQGCVLLDWGRARLGPPLEDVCSWLQSTGYWEPEVKRRHDSLLRRYLEARGLPDHLSPELRQLYWTAAASNAMAGALRYHLALALDPQCSDRERCDAIRAAQDWLRMVRRADDCWKN